jgi:hypothetical protein
MEHPEAEEVVVSGAEVRVAVAVEIGERRQGAAEARPDKGAADVERAREEVRLRNRALPEAVMLAPAPQCTLVRPVPFVARPF